LSTLLQDIQKPADVADPARKLQEGVVRPVRVASGHRSWFWNPAVGPVDRKIKICRVETRNRDSQLGHSGQGRTSWAILCDVTTFRGLTGKANRA